MIAVKVDLASGDGLCVESFISLGWRCDVSSCHGGVAISEMRCVSVVGGVLFEDESSLRYLLFSSCYLLHNTLSNAPDNFLEWKVRFESLFIFPIAECAQICVKFVTVLLLIP